jgi:hypothetical protein
MTSIRPEAGEERISVLRLDDIHKTRSRRKNASAFFELLTFVRSKVKEKRIKNTQIIFEMNWIFPVAPRPKSSFCPVHHGCSKKPAPEDHPDPARNRGSPPETPPPS